MAQSTDYIGNKLIISGCVKISRKKNEKRVGKQGNFFKNFIYLFLGRREGREKEREKNINVWLPLACPMLGTWPATQACTLTRDWTCDPLVHSPVLNPLSYSSQGK